MIGNLEEMIKTIEVASDQILSEIDGPVEYLLMLGTGLGSIADKIESVSYTHLTLPTSDLV